MRKKLCSRKKNGAQINYFSRQNTLVLILYRAIISIFFRHSEIFTILILQIPRRRRSCILETLKEYEDLERESPTVTPGIILFFYFLIMNVSVLLIFTIFSFKWQEVLVQARK